MYHQRYNQRERKSNRTILRISGEREKVNDALKKVVKAFGERNVVHEHPSFNPKTGFWFVFVNIISQPSSEGEDWER